MDYNDPRHGPGPFAGSVDNDWQAGGKHAMRLKQNPNLAPIGGPGGGGGGGVDSKGIYNDVANNMKAQL